MTNTATLPAHSRGNTNHLTLLGFGVGMSALLAGFYLYRPDLRQHVLDKIAEDGRVLAGLVLALVIAVLLWGIRSLQIRLAKGRLARRIAEKYAYLDKHEVARVTDHMLDRCRHTSDILNGNNRDVLTREAGDLPFVRQKSLAYTD